MSKRKKADPNPEEEEDDLPVKTRSQVPQKVYDFHKKTIEVYPERLLDLNQQFLSSIQTQIKSEPYSVLVGNCLDYVRQYFNYEDDLLKYSPWLAARLKQSRSDISKCLQETIDVYEALARHDFDRLAEKTNIIPSDSSSQQVRPTPSFSFSKPTANEPVPTTTTNFSFSKSTANEPLPTTTNFSFAKTTNNETNLNLAKSISNDSVPSSGFKLPGASPEKSTPITPFSFSIPNTGFGTSTFGNLNTTEKTTFSFTTPSKISFTPPVPSEQPATNEDNEDEASEPPEPEKVEHESDAKYTYRCRMGVNKSGKLIKRGPVQVNLKEVSDKRQLIVRSDDTLGRLYLNILWSKLIELKKNSSKDLTFVCKLNPGMPEVTEGEFVMILFRFDNETDRNDAFDKLDKERS